MRRESIRHVLEDALRAQWVRHCGCGSEAQ
jgi:hypothetical protein